MPGSSRHLRGAVSSRGMLAPDCTTEMQARIFACDRIMPRADERPDFASRTTITLSQDVQKAGSCRGQDASTPNHHRFAMVVPALSMTDVGDLLGCCVCSRNRTPFRNMWRKSWLDLTRNR